MLTLTIIALLALLALLACIWLAYHAYRAPDMSRYDAPEPDLMMSEDDISAAHEAVVQKLKDYYALPSTTDVKLGRQRLEDIFFREVDAEIKPVDAGGVPGEWVLAEGADPDKRLLYIHGGAFMVGSPRSHRYITSELSRRAGVAVLAIDYRMMPEFKVIHCHEDVRLAYRWILGIALIAALVAALMTILMKPSRQPDCLLPGILPAAISPWRSLPGRGIKVCPPPMAPSPLRP